MSEAERPRPRRTLLLQGTFSYGEGSLQHACLRAAGLVNVLSGSAGWGATPSLNSEQLLALRPELIFVAAEVEQPRPARVRELPDGLPWEALAAVREGRVFALPAAWMASISHHALLACEAYLRFAHETS